MTVRACFYCREIGTRALRRTRSVGFILLASVKLTQHPSYDPVFFIEAFCIVALIIDRFGLGVCLTIDSQNLIMHRRFADLHVRIGWSYLHLLVRDRNILYRFPLHLPQDHLLAEVTNYRDCSRFVLVLILLRSARTVSRNVSVLPEIFYRTFIRS